MKYTIQEKGYGKYKHKVPKEISEKKAENLRKEGRPVYDSKEEAREKC
jgi:hypothetical protein